MKRSGFKQKARKPMRRSPMSRSTKPLQRKSPLKAGKKTKQWNWVRASLKIRFERVGITTCELRGRIEHECGADNYLGFAHDAKRRKLTADDLDRVILICNFAHDIIEIWPAEKMKAIINETIEQRSVRP